MVRRPAEIVHDHDAGLERWHEELLDIDFEAFAVAPQRRSRHCRSLPVRKESPFLSEPGATRTAESIHSSMSCENEVLPW
jgi:hypothetical protein